MSDQSRGQKSAPITAEAIEQWAINIVKPGEIDMRDRLALATVLRAYRDLLKAQDVRALIEKARQEVYRLAKTGGKSWLMCIPVQPNDSDVVLCDALEAADKLLDALDAAPADVPSDADEPSVMGAGCGLSPLPLPLTAVEREHVEAAIADWESMGTCEADPEQAITYVDQSASLRRALACSDALAALRSAADVPQREAWQDIATAPKDGRFILVAFPEIGVWSVRWSTEHFADGFWSVSDNKSEDRSLRGWLKEPTAWMPLPAPPQEIP